MGFAPLNPAGYVTGTGKLTRCQLGNKGWDVRALQAGINVVSSPCVADGDFGPKTFEAVRFFQGTQGITADGWAGHGTQKTLTLRIWYPIQTELSMPPGLGRGQIGHESGFLVGNHSPARQQQDVTRYPNKPDPNGNYFDNGVSQMASEYYGYDDAFSPAIALRYYGDKIVGRYREYKSYGKIADERRLWELAAGSWNRPAWTQLIAKGSGNQLTASEREWIEAYIDRVTYLMVIR